MAILFCMLGEKENNIQVAYIYGRPSSHPMQVKCAEILNADFYPVDFKIRWHDKPDANKWLKYFSWIICAFTFPNVKKYNVFLAGGLHVTMPLMRVFKQIRKNQKIIVHLGDHTLYFLYSKKYLGRVRQLYLWSLSKYDAIIVEGKMGAYFAKQILGEKLPPIYCVTSGIPKLHFNAVVNNQPNLNSKKILFMGQGPNENRMFYKGLDITINAFNKASNNDSELELIIIGEWELEIKNKLLSNLNASIANKIHFIGQVDNLAPYMGTGFVYLHCARGEAFGVTVLIAMLAGMIPIVSELTGAKEVVELVDPDLIVELETDSISKQIIRVINLSKEEKLLYSEKCKALAKEYSEENVMNNYKVTFEKVCHDLFY